MKLGKGAPHIFLEGNEMNLVEFQREKMRRLVEGTKILNKMENGEIEVGGGENGKAKALISAGGGGGAGVAQKMLAAGEHPLQKYVDRVLPPGLRAEQTMQLAHDVVPQSTQIADSINNGGERDLQVRRANLIFLKMFRSGFFGHFCYDEFPSVVNPPPMPDPPNPWTATVSQDNKRFFFR